MEQIWGKGKLDSHQQSMNHQQSVNRQQPANHLRPSQRLPVHETVEMIKKAHKTINRRTIDYNSVIIRYLEVC